MRPAASSRKLELRREGLARRQALDPAWRAQASDAIRRRLLALDQLQAARTVALFSSFGAEVETHRLIADLLHMKKKVVLPCVLHGLRELELRRIDAYPEGHHPSKFGILEPEPLRHPEVVGLDQVDLLFVPAVVFDRAGYRIGYGGGYYDRLLLGDHTACVIGLAFACQVIDAFPHDPWDRPVDAVLTEAGLLQVKPMIPRMPNAAGTN